jgi:hypothetical protein
MSTLKTNTLSNVAGTASTAIENAINGSAKAWVNFNGTGTVAIRGSYNVTSITDNGTGLYTVNFTNAMPDANYAVTGGGGNIVNTARLFEYQTRTVNSVRVGNAGVFNAYGAVDMEEVSVAIFR